MASFEKKVYKSGRCFTIPKDVRTKLGIHTGDSVFLTIKSQDQTVLFRGRKTLKSGPEIYGKDISSALTPGSTIWVEASRPNVANPRKSHRAITSRAIATRPHPSKDITEEDGGRTRRYWIASPNVMNDSHTVGEWRNKSVLFKAAFMGWGPSEKKHKRIEEKFAHQIKPGDIILIARRHDDRPEVVGFGVVTGDFRTSLRGFKAPETSEWHGSLRVLSPFLPWTELPKRLDVMRVLRHTTALRQLIPERNTSEKLICEWLEATIGSKSASRKRTNFGVRKQTITRLTRLPHNRELEYQVRSAKQIRLAWKREAELVYEYDQWLSAQQRVLTAANYKGLKCDAYEEGRNNLIEAKSSQKREIIRMAVGQLLDYAYLGEAQLGKPNLAILLPDKPTPEIESWLKERLKISVIWRAGSAFLDNANGKFT